MLPLYAEEAAWNGRAEMAFLPKRNPEQHVAVGLHLHDGTNASALEKRGWKGSNPHIARGKEKHGIIKKKPLRGRITKNMGKTIWLHLHGVITDNAAALPEMVPAAARASFGWKHSL